MERVIIYPVILFKSIYIFYKKSIINLNVFFTNSIYVMSDDFEWFKVDEKYLKRERDNIYLNPFEIFKDYNMLYMNELLKRSNLSMKEIKEYLIHIIEYNGDHIMKFKDYSKLKFTKSPIYKINNRDKNLSEILK